MVRREEKFWTAIALSAGRCKITFSGIVDGKKETQLLDEEERLRSAETMICGETGARGRDEDEYWQCKARKRGAEEGGEERERRRGRRERTNGRAR